MDFDKYLKPFVISCIVAVLMIGIIALSCCGQARSEGLTYNYGIIWTPSGTLLAIGSVSDYHITGDIIEANISGVPYMASIHNVILEYRE